MNVLQLISSQGYYGMENMLVSLAVGLSGAGVRPLVGVFEDARDPHVEVAERARECGMAVELIPCSGRFDIQAVRRLRRLIREHRIDVVHTHGYKADIYASLAGRDRAAALVATSHNWPSRRLNMRAYAVVDRYLLRRFDAVAVVSEHVAGKLERAGVRRDLIVSIPNGIDTVRFREAAPTLPHGDAPLIGCVGRAVPGKGGVEFLQVARLVLARFPETRFVWIGDGPSLNDWKILAADIGIASNVSFTGARVDMPGVYSSLDVFVLPSLEEAMPVSLLEAMAAGCASIASNVGAVSSVIQPDVTGLLVSPGDVNGLASAIVQLIEDPTLANSLGAAAAKRIEAEFSIQRVTRRYLATYDAALSRRPSTSDVAVLERSES